MTTRKGKAVPVQPVACAIQHAEILSQARGLMRVERKAVREITGVVLPRLEGKVDGIAKGLESLASDLGKVMSIQVNGTVPLPGEFPLQTSLRGMHDVIAEDKVKIEFWDTFRRWREQVFFFRVLKSKTGRWIVGLILLTILNSIVNMFGGSISIQEILKLLKLTQ